MPLNLARRALRFALGRRLPQWEGQLSGVSGLSQPLRVRRDRHGVPVITASSDEDVWFGLGFCHAQDRGAQLELTRRIVAGRLSELVGSAGLPIDRLARRLGSYNAAGRQLANMDKDVRRQMRAYARGITAGFHHSDRPHELAMLGARPEPWQAIDCHALTVFLCFALASNWDVELVRLKILMADGPEALAALDPAYPEHLPVSSPPGQSAGPALDRLASDIHALGSALGVGGGSNAWAVAGSRTATGRPILANDPHMMPAAPSQWYLAHLRTPSWAACGLTMVGLPLMGAGHNGKLAWGITAAHVDITDVFLEDVGPDRASVRQGDTYVPCNVRREAIQVRGRRHAVVEEVLETPRGPIIGPGLSAGEASISLSATWLSDRPYRGFYGAHLCSDGAELAKCFEQGSTSTVCYVWADLAGHIGWRVAVEAPIRKQGWGQLPMAGWEPGAGWEDDPVPFAELPAEQDPEVGYVVAANNQPAIHGDGPFLGHDWLDGYRALRISEALEGRKDWSVAAMMALQQDTMSKPWLELRDVILRLPEIRPGISTAMDLLRAWDGDVKPDSVAASLFECFMAAAARRVVRAKAPLAADWALGRGFTELLPHNLMVTRRMGHLVRLIREQPEGWFEGSWDDALAAGLEEAMQELRDVAGPDPLGWRWSVVRPLTLKHPLGARPPLDKVFNVSGIRCGGDATTIHQAAVDWMNPTGNPVAIATGRLVIDVGDWDASRFVLLGGQSGNALSPHYADMVPLWERGQGIPIPWSADARAAVAHYDLTLSPNS